MGYFVYVIGSLKNSKPITYVGWTNNLKRRLNSHNSGMGAKSTRGKIWHMIYYETFNSKKDAMLEAWKAETDTFEFVQEKGNPATDIVDSYSLCKFGISQ